MATTERQHSSPPDHLPVTQRHLEAAGIATSLLVGGDGPPIVLLHGPAGNATHWMRVLPALAASHRVIAPDLPGHGGTDGCEPAKAIDWLGDVIERTCSFPPVLVGYALGGAIAARFAIGRGDRIRRLVLVDAFGLAPLEPAPEFGAALHAFLADPTDATHDGLWRYCAHDLAALRQQMDWDAFRAYNIDRTRAPGAVDALGGLLAEYGAPADLARIAVPAALIWGRHDLATPLAVAEAAAARHGWSLQVIEDCADDPPVEQPDALVQALACLALEEVLAATGFGGEIVGRGHPRYDELRAVFNGMIDRRPALIARCTGTADVSAAVGLARDRGLPLSVYGGGHNVTGNAVCDDGITIDLRPMKRIEIDPEARTCRAGAGLTWGELDAATQAHGLAVTGGRVSTTGLGGLALGGGSGWLERACGYTADNLLSVETVTADGEVRVASETENPDLFWGTRGGGGNLGVATAFELRLHPVGPTVLGGMLLYPAAMAAAVLRNFRDAMAGAPDEVAAGVSLLTAPDDPSVPEPVRGHPVCGVIVGYAGPLEEGREALRPLLEFGPPAVDLVAPISYVELQQLVDDGYPAGMRNHWTGDFLSGLPEEAIDVLCRHHLTAPSALTQILTFPGGGAAARVPDGTMALGERHAPFNVHITSLWADPAEDEANIAWTRALAAALRPFTTGRVYVNFIGDEGEERAIAAFGGSYPRLRELKDRYDPQNLFRSSQNVVPTRATAAPPRSPATTRPSDAASE